MLEAIIFANVKRLRGKLKKRAINQETSRFEDRAIAVKNEPESNTDTKIKTLPIKRYKEEEEEKEEDATPKKRK
ncbi:hypothetical protein EAG_02031 [Camponotus floridanus]|uniref:Uncharacterized protein n=1 Tax=Camponotus floridanus TaxID=104421 RepID=E2AYN4_CAMFO|nr:hypothetical protein EAG_02031 [Camponotus floridanus]